MTDEARDCFEIAKRAHPSDPVGWLFGIAMGAALAQGFSRDGIVALVDEALNHPDVARKARTPETS
jgi:hypothetical protein